jgi:hypothetical protein
MSFCWSMMGASDQTMTLLETAAQRDPRLIVISLSRNFGCLRKKAREMIPSRWNLSSPS